MQTRLVITCVLPAVLIVSACSSSKPQSKPDAVVTVTWQKAYSFAGTVDDYSAQFKMVKASWQPGWFEMGDVHFTEQNYCLLGDAISDEKPRHGIKVCFAVNEDKPYKLYPDDPLEPGTYPIGQQVPGYMYSIEKNKLVSFRLVVFEEPPKPRNDVDVVLQTRKAFGELKIMSANMKSITGQFHVDDFNLSVDGPFDCPLVPESSLISPQPTPRAPGM